MASCITTYHYWVGRQDIILSKYSELVRQELPLSSKPRGFVVEFRYHEKIRREYPPHDGDCRLLYSSTEVVCVKHCAANSKIAMRQILCPRLSSMGVPQEDHEKRVQETLFLARKSDSKKGLVGLAVEIVSFNVAASECDEKKVIDLAMEKSMKIQMFKTVPALDHKKPFIRALKNVGIVYDELELCGICLQRIESKYGGGNVTWLPCSHVYHGDCVAKWLQINPSCPACRSQFVVV